MSTTLSFAQMQSLSGFVVFLALAWLLSERKRSFSFVFAGLAIVSQFVLAAALLYAPPARAALAGLQVVTTALQDAAIEGSTFVFGYIGGGPTPFDVAEGSEPLLFIFAFQALPLLILMSGLSAVLWHWGVLKLVVRGMAALITRIFGVGGAVSLAAAANTFFGQTEAPLLIRPFMSKMTRGELFIVMTTGLATVAGTVIVIYANLLRPVAPSVLGHVIVASLISVPAAILMARIIVPGEKGEAPTEPNAADDFVYEGSMDAFMTGVTDGMKLFLNIIASLIAFVAAVALVNIIIAGVAPEIGGEEVTLQRIAGLFFAPLLWLAGVPAGEMLAAGELMGVKTMLNEIVAYVQLAEEQDALSDRTRLILIYALCGFANLSSLGIQIGAFSVLAPDRRSEIISLAPKALVAGTLATLMTGSVIGALTPA